jgi:trans-2,3-dihydro-3-hydroxyanthranilate isomerase
MRNRPDIMQLRFATLDVFTDRRFAGNPLAVVRDAAGLDAAAMQAIAREFNLSETVFVLPPADPAHRARLRIFTPASELPFAGHPTVGAAVLLGLDDGAGEHRFTVEEQVGLVQCVVTAKAAQGRATFALPQLPVEAGTAPDPERLAPALGLAPADLRLPGFRPVIYSAGFPIAFVPLCGLAAMGRCRPDAGGLSAAVGAGGPQAIFVFCRETIEAGSAFHARMFAPALGITEDPATGAAVAAFAGVLARFDPLDGERTLVVEQGYEMGRPSRITLQLSTQNGRLVRASIGGDAVVVSQGTIEA